MISKKSKRLNVLALLICGQLASSALALEIESSNGSKPEEAALGGQQFGDWVVRCETLKQGTGICVMSQTALAQENSARLLVTNIGYKAQSEVSELQFQLPLGISLRSPMVLSFDEERIREIPIEVCIEDGCYAQLQIDHEVLNKMLSMKLGELTLQGGKGASIALPISGKGAKAAFNAMKIMANKLDKRNKNG